MPELIKVDDYTSLKIEEYNGTYFIVEGWIGRDGDFKANWCDREFGPKDKKEKKRWPVKVKCGDKQSLLELADYIYGQYGDGAEQGTQTTNNYIPF